jgi:hypothetical protein
MWLQAAEYTSCLVSLYNTGSMSPFLCFFFYLPNFISFASSRYYLLCFNIFVHLLSYFISFYSFSFLLLPFLYLFSLILTYFIYFILYLIICYFLALSKRRLTIIRPLISSHISVCLSTSPNNFHTLIFGSFTNNRYWTPWPEDGGR